MYTDSANEQPNKWSVVRLKWRKRKNNKSKPNPGIFGVRQNESVFFSFFRCRFQCAQSTTDTRRSIFVAFLALVHAVATDARDCLYNFSGQFNRFIHDMLFFSLFGSSPFISSSSNFTFSLRITRLYLCIVFVSFHVFFGFSLLTRRYLLQYKNNM